jgi:anti-sigma-K factor RskA
VEHRELQDLIPAHALDALESEDALLLEQHVETCDACRRELDEMRETTALLAFATTPIEPPARLRASILDAVAEPLPAQMRPQRTRLAFLRGALAGTLAGAAIALVIGIALHSQLDTARSSRDAQAAVVASLLRPGSEVEPLTGNVQGAVVRNGSSGKLVMVDLPHTASGRTYQAWLIGPDKKPVPAGTFGGGKAVVVGLDGNARGPKTVAITVEPDGGSKAPTTAPVASAQLA